MLTGVVIRLTGVLCKVSDVLFRLTRLFVRLTGAIFRFFSQSMIVFQANMMSHATFFSLESFILYTKQL